MQSDGYSAYGSFKKRHPDAYIEYAACWAHARCKFHEARNESPLAAQTLFEIQGLYRIEAKLRDHPKQDRRTIRQQKSLLILRRIGLQLQSEQVAHRPKSHRRHSQTLGQAAPLHRTRLGRDRQQPRRERHSPYGHRQKERALLRQCRSRPHQRHPLYATRNLSQT